MPGEMMFMHSTAARRDTHAPRPFAGSIVEPEVHIPESIVAEDQPLEPEDEDEEEESEEEESEEEDEEESSPANSQREEANARRVAELEQ